MNQTFSPDARLVGWVCLAFGSLYAIGAAGILVLAISAALANVTP